MILLNISAKERLQLNKRNNEIRIWYCVLISLLSFYWSRVKYNFKSNFKFQISARLIWNYKPDYPWMTWIVRHEVLLLINCVNKNCISLQLGSKQKYRTLEELYRFLYFQSFLNQALEFLKTEMYLNDSHWTRQFRPFSFSCRSCSQLLCG